MPKESKTPPPVSTGSMTLEEMARLLCDGNGTPHSMLRRDRWAPSFVGATDLVRRFCSVAGVRPPVVYEDLAVADHVYSRMQWDTGGGRDAFLVAVTDAWTIGVVA